jgi:uncharacterized 2Fe-2S/4Fe-4S cluster protein (DUF4445 family)
LTAIDFNPVGVSGKCYPKESILQCGRRMGIILNSLCDGKGKCGSCKLQVWGKISKPTPEEDKIFTLEELNNGWRLACCTLPLGDCTVHIPPDSLNSSLRMQVDRIETQTSLKPAIATYRLKMKAPTLSAPTADADRLLEALNRQNGLQCTTFDFKLLHSLSDDLRAWNWLCQAVVKGHEIFAIIPIKSRHLGLAVDIGTTKIAGYLVDLDNGKTLAARGVLNPQISHGGDIITRVATAIRSQEEAGALRKLVVNAINKLANELCNEAKVSPQEILDAVIVGNTMMHHLFLGLPVKQLAIPPFVPAIMESLDIKAREIGLDIQTGAYVHILPNIAGYVGADHVAMLLAIEAHRTIGPVLVLDIGTNTEVSLIERDNIISASCASGPAFEGGHIKHGMRAVDGAIERIWISGGDVRYQTVNNKSPIGICGSGILDAMAQLYLAGIIDKKGTLVNNDPRVRKRNGERYFTLINRDGMKAKPGITISQADIRQFQLAKAAIRAGIQVLLETRGYVEKDIKEVIIAGAFGTFINIDSAVAIGMLPDLPREHFRQVGNAAGRGAVLALFSVDKRLEAKNIALSVKYVELAGAHDFGKLFTQACYLGEYGIALRGRKKVDV